LNDYEKTVSNYLGEILGTLIEMKKQEKEYWDTWKESKQSEQITKNDIKRIFDKYINWSLGGEQGFKPSDSFAFQQLKQEIMELK
jgi:thymidylate synthase